MRSLSIGFPAPEMEPESAHVVSAVSVLSSNVAICDAAPPRQHSAIVRYSAQLRYSVLCFVGACGNPVFRVATSRSERTQLLQKFARNHETTKGRKDDTNIHVLWSL